MEDKFVAKKDEGTIMISQCKGCQHWKGGQVCSIFHKCPVRFLLNEKKCHRKSR